MKAIELFSTDRGEGEAVLLAHAIGCDQRMWEGVAEHLA